MKRVVFILGLFVLMTAGAAQAQTHEGFWVGFGFGAGSLGIDGGTDRDTGGVGYVKLGGTINERFLLGEVPAKGDADLTRGRCLGRCQV